MTVNEKLDEIEARFDSDSAEEVIYAVPSMVKALRAVLEVHRDGGESQGYTKDGYGDIAHCCITCGSFGEYGEPYPCETVVAIIEVLGGAE